MACFISWDSRILIWKNGENFDCIAVYMKKFVSLYFSLVLLCGAYDAAAQRPDREKEYLRKDSVLWLDYEKRQQEISALWQQLPDRQDSIQQAFDDLLADVLRKNAQLAMEYASTPSGLQRLYMCRLGIPKDTLTAILDTLDQQMQESFYGRNIRQHIAVPQIAEGDRLFEFPCVTDSGEAFDWNSLKGLSVLLLYGGLDCMGEGGRQELARLWQETSRDELQVVVYWPVSSLEGLQQLKQKFPSDYIFVSDFKQDASPMKIRYGVQATPTCFYADAAHVVKVKCVGLHMELFNQYIKRNK